MDTKQDLATLIDRLEFALRNPMSNHARLTDALEIAKRLHTAARTPEPRALVASFLVGSGVAWCPEQGGLLALALRLDRGIARVGVYQGENSELVLLPPDGGRVAPILPLPEVK